MKNKSFSFDDVCLSPDAQIGRHSQSTWELSTVLKGSGIRTIGDCSEPITAREVVLVPPGITHQWKFDPDNCDNNGNIHNISLTFSPQLLTGIRTLFHEMNEKVANIENLTNAVSYPPEMGNDIRDILGKMKHLSQERRVPLFLELISIIGNTSPTRNVGSNDKISVAEKRLNDIEIYCKCNLSRHIPLDEMAAYTGMNKSALCTFLRNHKKMTFTEMLNEIRLEKAAELITASDANLSSIAFDCGFTSISYFNKLFKRRFQLSPGTYRRLYKEK